MNSLLKFGDDPDYHPDHAAKGCSHSVTLCNKPV